MTNKPTKEQVLAALGKVQEPELHEDLVTLNMIRDLNSQRREGVLQHHADHASLPLARTNPEGSRAGRDVRGRRGERRDQDGL